jgi:hypothetical protein
MLLVTRGFSPFLSFFTDALCNAGIYRALEKYLRFNLVLIFEFRRHENSVLQAIPPIF